MNKSEILWDLRISENFETLTGRAGARAINLCGSLRKLCEFWRMYRSTSLLHSLQSIIFVNCYASVFLASDPWSPPLLQKATLSEIRPPTIANPRKTSIGLTSTSRQTYIGLTKDKRWRPAAVGMLHTGLPEPSSLSFAIVFPSIHKIDNFLWRDYCDRRSRFRQLSRRNRNYEDRTLYARTGPFRNVRRYF